MVTGDREAVEENGASAGGLSERVGAFACWAGNLDYLPANARVSSRLPQQRNNQQSSPDGDIPRRTTRDVDFLGHGENSADEVKELFREIVRIEPDIDDGLDFAPDTVRAEQTQEEGTYSGVRVRVTARLGQARIPTRIDLGFGDALTDMPISTDLPVLLDLPAPHIRAYSAEAAVAEKLEAIVRFGTVNTRFKDFFDLYVLSRERTFEADSLRKQVEATFSRRDTDLPTAVPVGLTEEFGQSASSQQQWEAFLRSTDAEGAPREFSATLDEVRKFVYPVLDSTAGGRPLTGQWTPEEGWAGP